MILRKLFISREILIIVFILLFKHSCRILIEIGGSSMKKIGLVGGLGPASTVDYYLGYINCVRNELGENCYPEFVIDNVNMNKIVIAIGEKRYKDVADELVKSIVNMKNAGAEIAAITANAPHIAWEYMEDRFPIPVISIVDASVQEMLKKRYKRVVVFGVEFTMKNGLYDKKMVEKGIKAILPNETDIKRIGQLIYPNLENGIIIPEDREEMIRLAEKYIKNGNADAMLLGCTEIPLVIKEGDISVPVLNTTQIHLDAIWDAAK